MVEQPPTGAKRTALGSTGSSGSSSGEGGVLPPHTLKLGPLGLGPGKEVRRFVAVPAGATWAEIVIRAGAFDTPKVFLIR